MTDVLAENGHIAADYTRNNAEDKKEGSEDREVSLKRHVTLVGGVAMLSGAMVGSGIFISPTEVLFYTGSVALSLIVWVVCGLVVMMALLCYVELGLSVRKSGGTYTYLKEGFGPVVAFLFAYVNLLLLRPVGIAILALTFSNYALQLAFDEECGPPPENVLTILSITVIFLVTGINGYSVLLGLRLQVVFLVCKVSAVMLVIVGGIVMMAQGRTDHLATGFQDSETDPGRIALSFYSGMWAYSGWIVLNDVLEEIKEPEKNLPRAILLAIPSVIIVYLLCNISYFTVLAPSDVLSSPAVAYSWAQVVIPGWEWVIPVLVALSVLGTLLIMGFAYGRVMDRFAREKQMISVLGMVQVNHYTPLPGIISLALIGSICVLSGDIRSLMSFFSFLEWFWIFCCFLVVVVLRFRRKDLPRPFKVPLIIPVLMTLVSLFLVVAPLVSDPVIENFYALLGILSGLVFYVPFLHFQWTLPGFDRVTTFIQLLLQVSPRTKDD